MKKSITQKDIEKSVLITKRGATVRSDKLAKMFNRTHKQVLATIRQKIEFLEENSFSLRDYFLEEMGINGLKISQYFIDEKYKTQGGEHTRYQLTRKGFDLVALSLTGKIAFQYKVWYIDSFHKKQEIIEEHKLTAKVNMSDDLWLQFRQEGIKYRNKLTKAIQENIVNYRENVEKKMNDGKYYYHYTELIYKVLGIELPKGTNPRDVLDKRMLVRLEDMEVKVADLIEKHAKDGMYYKEAYKAIRDELLD